MKTFLNDPRFSKTRKYSFNGSLGAAILGWIKQFPPDTFDRYEAVELGRLSEQFNQEQRERLDLDAELVGALNPDIDLDEAKQQLSEVYDNIGEALRRWIGG